MRCALITSRKRPQGAHALLESLVNLLAGLEDSHDKLKYSSWADADYEYMEVTLPDGIDLELDLNVHGPRVFIRSIRLDS